MNKSNKFHTKIFWLTIILLAFSATVFAQTTAFTYQGRFNDTSVPSPTNGTYNMQFALYTTQGGGTYLGSPITIPNVQVTNGIFTVTLDFDAGNPTSFFGGGSRFLEIRVFDTATSAYITLNPQQEITSTPYAIRAKSAENAVSLGGVLAGQFPTIGQVIRNQTNTQATANFSIDGTGSANIFNTATQYNIADTRVLSTPGTRNLFVGGNAGSANTTGEGNSFIGSGSGSANTIGIANSFFGDRSGVSNTSGSLNSFFGGLSGLANTLGGYNSFFGESSGISNSTGSFNSFVGNNAGQKNTTGSGNSFFGESAGLDNITGINNTIIGNNANVGSGSLSYATAIGADAVVTTSNTIVLGRTGTRTRIMGISSTGTTQLCLNTTNEVSLCSSSLRYKTNIAPFLSGLSFINQLRPISFDWKEGGMKDIGFGAEDVAEIDPLFVNYNEKGEVEGVKYDRFSVLFVNAIKEQQTQIANQKEQIELLKTQNQNQQLLINELQKLVCLSNKNAEICKEKK